MNTYAQNLSGKRGGRKETQVRIPIDSGWRFRDIRKDAWYPAAVPGCVHLDLLKNKLIEDPFYRDNETKLQWIGKQDWEYQTTLNIAEDVLKHEQLELVFEGLDTYATVFLNDTQLLSADNMFRTWRVDCKGALKPGSNVLRVVFRSPINEILPVMAKRSYQLPSPNDQGEKTAPFTRKAPYQFGWDWGPRFVTSGIWKPAYIEAWDDARLSDLHISQQYVDEAQANLTAEIEAMSVDASEATLVVDDTANGAIMAQKQVSLTPGVNTIKLGFTVRRPALWWPNGLGAHPLYRFRARLLRSNRVTDEKSVRVGLRSLELRQQPDQWGRSFEFLINHVPVFAKGGNWIPADSFPTRVTKEKYRQLLGSVRDSNMNMLRVWGGGIYENDMFYELCDQMGIMVWQDFMFAGSMYPANPEFLENVRHEAIDNVKRLRNHPSLVIWAGNNEIDAGWHNWGWKQSLPASLWDDYTKIFAGVLQEVCAALDPKTPYWPSSPMSGMPDDPGSTRSGDMHFWQVWHASEPFSSYEGQLPRFLSEYGFQSFPQLETVAAYTLPSDRDIQSPVMLAHQRHPRGNQLIREYMLRDYREPKDFESFLYLSQVLQAEGIKLGAEHFRRIRPRNMGSLYWQIDDCWPVASWSSIDYFGRWKALQYYSRRFYNDLLISPHAEGDNLHFYVVSDRLTAVPAQVHVTLMNFEGEKLFSEGRNITIKPNNSSSYLDVPLSSLLKGRDTTNLMVHCELVAGGQVVSRNEYFFSPPKKLALPRPSINVDVLKVRGGYKITLASDKFARAVYLSLDKQAGFFADNYFDLLPGEKFELIFHTRKSLPVEAFKKLLSVRTMVDALSS
jgi:beta-mannosidase